MKKIVSAILLLVSVHANAQLNLDTLAIQDFEVAPQAPVWTFTGPVIYNSGYSSPTAAPPNSPIGIGGSRAWETTTNSGGLVLEFANINIPTIYDSIRVHFNLAAMNLAGSTGGPDDLDYVLVQFSTDGGTTYFNRLRIRGAINNNCFWPYSATGVAKVYYQPATEVVFQPVNSGLATTLGYSNCEIVFPGSVTQVRMKITGRSSSSTDTWLVDNLLITGENVCNASASTISASACETYTSPSGNYSWTSSGTFLDTIPNSTGCDSVMTINLSILNASASNITVNTCSPSYVSPSGNHVWTSSGIYSDTVPNQAGCDSVISVNLSISNASSSTISPSTCTSYNSPSGNYVWTSSGVYQDTLQNVAGCDSVITVNLTILNSTAATIAPSSCDDYTSPSGNYVWTSSGTYFDTIPNSNGCDSVITVNLTIVTVDASVTASGATLTANAAGATYQWIDCDNANQPIAGATSQSYTTLVTGNFAVIVSIAGCTDTSACQLVTVTDITGERITGRITAYPNPVTDFLVMEAGSNAMHSTFQLCDLSGKILLSGEWQGRKVILDLQKFAPGVYVLKSTEAGSNPLRIVKQ